MAEPEVVQLLVQVSRLGRIHDAVLARLAARHGLMASETAGLLMLWWAGPPHRLRPSVLAEALVQTTGGMTATLRRLAEAGFVERVPDPDDGRVSLAALTPAGEAAGRASLADMVDWYDEALVDVPARQRTRIVAAMGTLLGAVEAADGHAPTAGLAFDADGTMVRPRR